MKKLVNILFSVSLCITIVALYPSHATCEEPLQICSCDTGVMDVEISSTAAEITTTDHIDPYTSGFTITSTAPGALNDVGGNYIFLAIA